MGKKKEQIAAAISSLAVRQTRTLSLRRRLRRRFFVQYKRTITRAAYASPRLRVTFVTDGIVNSLLGHSSDYRNLRGRCSTARGCCACLFHFRNNVLSALTYARHMCTRVCRYLVIEARTFDVKLLSNIDFIRHINISNRRLPLRSVSYVTQMFCSKYYNRLRDE